MRSYLLLRHDPVLIDRLILVILLVLYLYMISTRVTEWLLNNVQYD